MAKKTNSALLIGNRLDWIVVFCDAIKAVDLHTRSTIGVNITQCRILFHLALFPEIPIGSIATSLSLKPSTTTAAIDSLEKKGFVERFSNTLDKRSVCLRLTENGRTASIAVVDQFVELVNTSLSYLKFDNRPVLRNALLKDLKKMPFDNGLSDKEIISNIISNTDNISDGDASIFITSGRVVENMCYFCCKLTAYDHERGITPNDSKVLRLLGNNYPDPLVLKSISDTIHIKPNVTTVSIKSLTNKGLITRELNEDDHRAYYAVLTKKAIEYLEASNNGFVELFDFYYPELSGIQPSDLLK